jgi:hypothetical protein
MKRGNSEPLTAELQAELDALAAMPDSEIDNAGQSIHKKRLKSKIAAFSSSHCELSYILTTVPTVL